MSDTSHEPPISNVFHIMEEHLRSNEALVILGYGAGPKTADTVAGTIEDENLYKQVRAMTIEEALTNPERLERDLANRDLISHSAGALVLKSIITPPFNVFAFGAPLPQRRLELIKNSGSVTRLMHTDRPEGDNLQDLLEFDLEYIKEISRHPEFYLKLLAEISTYNAVETASWLREEGVPSTLFYGTKDALFYPKLTPAIKSQAEIADVKVMVLNGVQHNDPIVWPKRFFSKNS